MLKEMRELKEELNRIKDTIGEELKKKRKKRSRKRRSRKI